MISKDAGSSHANHDSSHMATISNDTGLTMKVQV